MIKEARSGSGEGVGYSKDLEFASGGCMNPQTLVKIHARHATTKQNLPNFLTNKTISLQFIMTVDENGLACLLNSLQCQSQNSETAMISYIIQAIYLQKTYKNSTFQNKHLDQIYPLLMMVCIYNSTVFQNTNVISG
jgi:ABC-type transporter Mla MlaB component